MALTGDLPQQDRVVSSCSIDGQDVRRVVIGLVSFGRIAKMPVNRICARIDMTVASKRGW